MNTNHTHILLKPRHRQQTPTCPHSSHTCPWFIVKRVALYPTPLCCGYDVCMMRCVLCHVQRACDVHVCRVPQSLVSTGGAHCHQHHIHTHLPLAREASTPILFCICWCIFKFISLTTPIKPPTRQPMCHHNLFFFFLCVCVCV